MSTGFRKSLRAFLAGSLVFVGVALAMPAQIAGASTQLVTNCNDSGPGSLRQAVLDAASGDSIDFALSPKCSTIILASTIDITTSLTMDGPGANALAVSGNGVVEVLGISNAITANISGMTIEDGFNPTGGGIANSGTLNLSNSVLSDNGAANPGDKGAGIWNGGALAVDDSTFSGNNGWDGGGISNSGTMTVTDSTFSGNTAGDGGGGIFNLKTSATVTDSTFSGNSTRSGAVGGGIYNDGGNMTLIGSTLSGNSATIAGGIYNDSTLIAAATIVANSPSGGDCSGFIPTESPAHITDAGYNIDDDNSCGFSSVNHSISGSTTVDLGPLANNGGPTETLLPAATSSAVGVIPTGTTLNGVQVCPRVDQRGVASVGNCTIGAVEVPLCAIGLTPHVLNASYAKGTFTGLFCVNAKGVGTYTQGALSGFGWVSVVKGTTVIAALGKNLLLAGSTNGTKSSFLELAPAPIKFGTFTLS